MHSVVIPAFIHRLVIERIHHLLVGQAAKGNFDGASGSPIVVRLP